MRGEHESKADFDTEATSVDWERLVTVNDVAERFGVAPSWVYEKAADGTLPSLKIGVYIRFKPSEIEEFLKANARPRSKQ